MRDFVKRSRALEGVYRRAVSLWPYARRLGGDFWGFYDHLEQAQFLPPERLREAQFAALGGELRWAYTHSGFYRRLWDAHGVGPGDVRTPEDLARLPVVDRDQMFAAHDLSVPMARRVLTSTSGTSGTPFQFWTDRRSASLELAAIFHQWSRAGFAPGDERVELRGFQVQPIVEIPDHNVVRLSVVNMEAHLETLLSCLNRRRIPYLHGYPSALSKLAGLMRERGRTLDYEVQGVFLASEAVYDWQVDRITEVFAPRHIIAHFGTAERVVLGAWCEHARVYHFLDPYGVFEQGPAGEIIGTSLINRATPFVRYRLNDVVLDAANEPCAACGRGYTPVVRRIGGRLEDYLVTERGELVPPAVVTFPFKHLRVIQATQMVQRADRSVLLRCVFGSAPAAAADSDRETLRRGLRDMLGASIRVSFEDVDEIPTTSAGKVRWIVSEVAGAEIKGDLSR
jgi:phenylacetate-coenzyme A ligase PaaK-like adenylate-forming protein